VDSTEVAAFTEEDQALIVTIGRALAGPIDLAGRYAAEQRATALRDAFTGVISHELRTPITTIYGMSQVLRQHSETEDPETHRQSIADIEEEAEVDAEVDAEPSAHANVGWAEEALGIGFDQRLLDTVGCREPDRPPVIVVPIGRRDEDPLADEPRRFAVAVAFDHLGEREAGRPDAGVGIGRHRAHGR
jgi:light-regulated signal transduction histidine kinase (bacteriophytochrome)